MSPRKSTTVRTIGRAPAPVRALFRALDPVAPSVAARGVEHLWFRLPRAPSADRRHAATPLGGTPFGVRRGGVTVRGRTYGSDEAPTAHLVHGWAGWWQQLAPFVAPLREAGYRVVVHDAPSHGDSPAGRHGARSSTVMELADAFAAVVWQQGPADLVVAHSIGAMATMWAREAGTQGGAYVFLAAAASIDPMLDGFEHMLGLGPRTPQRVRSRVERRIGHTFEAFDVPAMALTDADLPPLLAVHDQGDRFTPASGTLDLARAWPGAELTLTHGLGHRRILRDDSVIVQVQAFAERVRPGVDSAPAPEVSAEVGEPDADLAGRGLR